MSPLSADNPNPRTRGRAVKAMFLAALFAVGVVLAACGSSSDGTDSSSAATGDPVTGGTLTFARSLDAEAGLDPINAPNNGSIFTIQQIFDQLVEVQGDKIVPGLAESWEHSPDGLEWTFHLRDAQFSNGDPVTPEDVKFSIERFADPKVNVNYATLGAAIDSVDVVDDKTVKINLNSVDGAFLDNLAMFAAAIVPQKVVEQEGDKDFAENPVGSGPFMVTEFKRGQETVLERNPHYWREGEPYLDGVTFEYVPDANTRTLKLRSGEVDVADALPLQPGRIATGDRRHQRRGGGLPEVGLHLPQHEGGSARRGRGPSGPQLRDAEGADPRQRPVRQRRCGEQPDPAGQVLGRVDRPVPVRHHEGPGADGQVERPERLRSRAPDPVG